jgi:gamma-glutamyl phosphate reductase
MGRSQAATMGIPELTTTKFVVSGSGQIRT